MKKLVTILLVMLVNCSHAQFMRDSKKNIRYHCSLPNIYVFSNRFPEDKIAVVDKAFEYWNNAVGKKVFLRGGTVNFNSDIVRNPPFIVVDIDVLNQKSCGRAYLHHTKLICTSGATVALAERCLNHNSEDFTESVFRHEIGHILGLGHSDFNTDLMYPTILKMWNHPKTATEQEIQSIKNFYYVTQEQ